MRILINIGEKIKKAMKNQKITQKELGKRIEVTENTIQNYVSNRREPNIETIYKIANALNISIEELIIDNYKSDYKLKHEIEICKKAINTFGEYTQLDMVIEEMAELTQAISKFKRNKIHNVEEEIADVEIMLSQLRLMTDLFDIKVIDEIKEEKLKRLEGVVW